MGEHVDLTGEKFHRLTPIEYIGKGKWICRCDCGNFTTQQTHSITHGIVKSCGCYAKERTSIIHIAEKHGQSKTRIFITWRNMRVRCRNPKDKRYKHYGERGIKVCDEWNNSFETFRDWALSHGYTDELTIDRIDVNGNYCPENCRFITRAENNRNRRPWTVKKRKENK